MVSNDNESDDNSIYANIELNKNPQSVKPTLAAYNKRVTEEIKQQMILDFEAELSKYQKMPDGSFKFIDTEKVEADKRQEEAEKLDESEDSIDRIIEEERLRFERISKQM